MVHQAAKLNGEEKEKFIEWLYDLEFNIYQIPKPDHVIFLDVDPEVSQELMRNRANKFTGEEAKDIAEKYNWDVIKCCKNSKLRSIEEINDEIYEKVKKYI